MAPTAAQLREYNLHKQVCQNLGFLQSTFKHRTLPGTISTPSATGNVKYTGPGPESTDEPTTDTLVWAVWRPMERTAGGGDDIIPGRLSAERLVIQWPFIDDAGNPITVSHADWIQIGTGVLIRVENPAPTPDDGFWLAIGERQR